MSENTTAVKSSFVCANCELSVKYDYFGKKPQFSKNTVLLEDAYVMKDPFTDDHRCIILGSHCVICNRTVCVSQECSLFYTKRFCLQCISANIDQFPTEIQLELQKTKGPLRST